LIDAWGDTHSQWEEFKHRYFVEPDTNPEAVRILMEMAEKSRVTLIFSSREVEFNQAIVLKGYLLAHSNTMAG
jgi:uncharacterized protein YeaO (DUF488 family)